MRKLIDIELIKIFKLTSFKVLIGLHFLLFVLVVFVTSRIDITIPGFDTASLFRFPYVWSYFSWIASWFNLLLVITVIIITGNEYSYRTFRQHVIDGLNRQDLLYGKLLVIVLISTYGFLLVLGSGLVYGSIFSYDFNLASVVGDIHLIFVYYLQTLAYMVIGLMLVILFRSTALTIILFFLLRFPIEPIIRSFFASAYRPYFPFKTIGGLTPIPEFISISSENQFPTAEGGDALTFSEMGFISGAPPLLIQILLTLLYMGIFLYVTSYLLKKRSL